MEAVAQWVFPCEKVYQFVYITWTETLIRTTFVSPFEDEASAGLW